MKKINAIAWLITMLMTIVASKAFAASGEKYEVEVGKTIRLEISSLGKSVMISSNSYKWEYSPAYIGDDTDFSEFAEMTEKTWSYATVKGIKAGQLVTIMYTGYYYNYGVRQEFNDVFYVRVVDSGTPANGPATLEVYPTPRTMKVGDTEWVYAKQTRAIGGTYFYSEDESIASVTLGELTSPNSYTTAAQITAKKKGKVNIVAKNANGLSAVCEVTVTTPAVTGIGILSDLALEIGDTYVLTPVVAPIEAEPEYFLWSSSNNSVAVVSQSGVVTAKSAGTTDITVKTDNGKTARCRVTVKAQPTTSKNVISIEDVTGYSGKCVQLPIGMENEDPITAFQMDLYVDFSITTDENGDELIDLSERAGKSHVVSCSKLDDGAIRIICYSPKNEAFSGQKGTILNLTLSIGDSLADDTYDVYIRNIELSDNKGVAHQASEAHGSIDVKTYLLGDVDGNWKHTINDAVCILNYILGRSNDGFIKDAADVDGNGSVSVNDAVQLINKYILNVNGKAGTGKRAQMPTAQTTPSNFLYMEDIEMQPGEARSIEVMMVNERDDIRGLQCDITLPEGLSFLFDEDAEDYVTATSRVPRKLALSSEMQSENTLRVAGVCTGSSSIYGNSGSVFTFKVKADESMPSGKYKVLLSNMELSYGEAILVDDRKSLLEILNVADSIASLSSEGENNTIMCDLNGRRIDVSKAKNGVFIVNGKKVLIK